MEARERLSSTLFGRDDHVPAEDDLWRESRGAQFLGTSGTNAGAVCDSEPDDASGDATKLCRVSDVDSQL